MSNRRRVVVTGMGVVSPNAVGLSDFSQALRQGTSGVEFNPELEVLGFGCQVSGIPPIDSETLEEIKKEYRLIKVRNHGLIYGVKAGVEAWQDAGFGFSDADKEPLWDTGCIFGAGALGVDAYDFGVPLVRSGNVRKLGSRLVLEAMNSATSSYLTSLIGFGNMVTSNSSACCTGTESVVMAYDRIASGQAECMLAGSCETDGPIIWGVFDSLRVLTRAYNDNAQIASRPMSQTARGFVPGAGAGALVLEEYERAKARGAKIYAEVLAVYQNSGGQRQGGSKTAPNVSAITRCIKKVLQLAEVEAKDIDLIGGHLTSTMADPLEIEAWTKALELDFDEFPMINSTKSMIGHCIGAAGSIETVATLLQMNENFIHPSINCSDVHEKIKELIPESSIPQESIDKEINYAIKANFAFGDVNTCILFKSM